MRPSWNEYYMDIAETVKRRSTCMRRQVGALLVLNKKILATGYNGSPKGLRHCNEIGCMRNDLQVPSGERHELCRGLHAEQNAIIQAAMHGVKIEGADLYVTHKPCVVCAKMIINSGVEKVVFKGDYPDRLSDNMFKEAGIVLEHYEEETPSGKAAK
jgi:dCMP deaminase